MLGNILWLLLWLPGLKFFINTGIIANRFISNPIQMSSQCELIITSMVPDITVMIRVV